MKRLMLTMLAFSLIFSVTSASVFAAGVKIGAKGGLNLAKLVGDDMELIEEQVDFKKGFCGGIFIALHLTEMLALQPEVLFTVKGTELKAGFLGEAEELLDEKIAEVSTELQYIEIPILAKILIPIDENFKPNVFAGPAIGINLSAKSKFELMGVSREEDLEDIKDIDLGLVVGGGIEFGRLIVEARYVMSLETIADSETDIEPDMKNQVISVMAGFSF